MMNLAGPPRRPEIDQYAIKFLIGAIALLLPAIEWGITHGDITSISGSFWNEYLLWITRGLWPRNVFVGLLFAIAALLLTYNGENACEMWLTKLAAVAAFLIAMFPCDGGVKGQEQIVAGVHASFAGVMFLVLGIFCEIFRRRAMRKGHREARWRAVIYSACGLGIVASFALFALGAFMKPDTLLLPAEVIGLVSFSVSWLTASHVLPVINDRAERKHLFA